MASAASSSSFTAADHFVDIGYCPTSKRNITICYNTFGDAHNPCMLLIMGLNCHGMYWDTRFCQLLVDAGYYVIRYDHRDVGLSTSLGDLPSPFIGRLALPRWLSVGECALPYTLDDMASDAMRMLTALHIDKAHIVGCSMGGMIAQILFTQYSDRVLSVCLLSTSSTAPKPKLHILPNLLDYPRGSTEKDLVDYKERFFRPLAGELPFPTDEFRAGAALSFQRCPIDHGAARHLAAIARAPNRTEALTKMNAQYPAAAAAASSGGVLPAVARRVLSRIPLVGTAAENTPTRTTEAETSSFIPVVILHGGSDPIIPIENARQLSRVIAGSILVEFPLMGHYFPPLMFSLLTDEIVLNARRSLPRAPVMFEDMDSLAALWTKHEAHPHQQTVMAAS